MVERCVLFCDGTTVEVAHLPAELREGPAPSRPSPAADATLPGLGDTEPVVSEQGAGLKEAVREATAKVERELIVRALDQTRGNVTHTARLLKISRKSLQTKMKELGLRPE